MIRKSTTAILISLILLLPIAAKSQPLFSPATLEIPIPELLSVAVADFNGDGQNDIAALNSYSDNADISIYLMQSDGLYSLNEISNVSGDVIVTGDIDGNTIIDLLVLDTQGYIFILLGNGNGTFGNPDTIDVSIWGLTLKPKFGAIGNLNGDNYADLVYGDSVFTQIFLGQGNGNFNQGDIINIGGYSEGYAVLGDLDNNGTIDLIIPKYATDLFTYNDSATVFLNNGSGSFTESATYAVGGIGHQYAMASDIDVGLIDNDTIPDIIVAPSFEYGVEEPALHFLKGNGDGTFQNAVLTPTGDFLMAIHPVDINQDSLMDLVVAPFYLFSHTNEFGIILGNGDGTFALPQWIPIPGQLNFRHLDDFVTNEVTGDSYEDLLIIRDAFSWGFTGLEILPGRGDTAFQSAVSYQCGLGPKTIVSADFNNDNYADLITANADSNSLTVLLNDGDGSFDNSVATLTTSRSPFIVKTADFNNDNNTDLIFADSTQVVVRLGDGTGGFGTFHPKDIPSALNDLVIADFNEDNIPDAAVSLDGSARRVIVYFGNGAGSFTDSILLDYNYDVMSITSDDFNKDNHSDLAVHTGAPMFSALIIQYGDGTGGFSDSSQYLSAYSGPFYNKLESGDFNNDTYPDLIYWLTMQPSVGEIWLNDGSGGMTMFDTLQGTVNYCLGITLADINGDSYIDVLTGSGDLVSVFLGDGTGDFNRAQYSYAGVPYPSMDLSSYQPLCTDDFNRDGYIDLAAVLPDTNKIAILFGQAGLTHDIAALSILEPTGNVNQGTALSPKAEILNIGIETDTCFVYFHIGSVYYDTIEIYLDPGQRDTAIFAAWNALLPGNYSTTCGVLFPADENLSNNLLSGQVNVIDTSSTDPMIISSWPTFGGNTGWLTTTITGRNFHDSAAVKLIRSGQSDILAGNSEIDSTKVDSSTSIHAVFNLNGRTTGLWDLVVTNPDSASDTLVNGMIVEPGNQHLWLDITGLTTFTYRRADIPLTYKTYAGNNGNVNLERVILEVTIPRFLKLESIVNISNNDTIAHGDSLVNAGLVDMEIIVPIYIEKIYPNEIKVFEFNCETIFDNYPQKAAKQFDALSDGASFSMKGTLLGSAMCFGKNLHNNYDKKDGLELQDFEDAGSKALDNLIEGTFWTAVKFGIQILFPVTIPFIQAYDLANLVMQGADLASQLTGHGRLSLGILFGMFLDPNDKAGPAGFGAEGYITGDRPFTYTIYFENVDSATLPVPHVMVVDTLDPDLDWSTLDTGDSKHGLDSMILDTSGQYGIVTFYFDDINLPPNNNPPEGQSWFNYTIWPDSNLSSGTAINNMAAIIFWDSSGQNEPILTSNILNTIDSDPPQSSIKPLSSTIDHVAFKLTWSGSDNESGIHNYSIYYSKDGSDYTFWNDTPDSSIVFIGQNGSTYNFYSVAIDNVGFVEAPPATPDATTTIDAEEDIGVNPNPYVPSRGHNTITFFGGDLAYSTIKIYNKAGRLVRTLEETQGEATLDWNATNSGGQKLASGVYIWYLSGPGGESKGKFSIIR